MHFDFADLLLEVLERKASDLHLTAGAHPTVRIRGRLVALEEFPGPDALAHARGRLRDPHERPAPAPGDGLAARLRLRRPRHRAVPRQRLRAAVGGQRRVPAHPDDDQVDRGPRPAGGHARVRPQAARLRARDRADRLGQVDSLAAVVDEVNRTRDDHILTIEDPIEFLHPHKRCIVNQREIGSDATTFAAGIKGALRQDPDVILVGEMRDLETIHTALTAAETGHLVFATLHTQDAPQTIDRIIDVFPPAQQQQVRVQLSVALQGVVTQQLLPTADGSGRVAACEVLVPTPAVRNLIREGKTHQILSTMQTGSNAGMQTMDAALATLVRQGKITQKLAEQRSSTPAELRRLLGQGGLLAA
jgi:twitching motility protein PilT